MRLLNVLQLGIVGMTLAGAGARAQRPVDPVTAVPRLDLSAGYEYTSANAPPGGCKCFGLNGGFASAGLNLSQWLAVEAQVTGGHANDISLLGQNLNLMTYMAGPRVTYHLSRFSVFGDALFGGAHGWDSYFPTSSSYTTSATSFALSGGGGVDFDLTPRFAIRAVQAQYVRTTFPNGDSNTQNHLIIGAGLVIKFRGRDTDSKAVVSEAPNGVTALACPINKPDVTEGQVVDVTGRATTVDHKGDVTYTWTASAGIIQGTGHRVTINTSGVATGDYTVYGHAVLADNSGTSADCEVGFHVNAKPAPVVAVVTPPPPPPAPVVAPAAVQEKVFHDNVPDALFDYDKWALRPDTQVAIHHAAGYLLAHPELRILIGGYSDERGSTEYNIALGLKRANAVRDALVAQGVASARMQVVSYGKGAQVCVAENEACWQQNRRAAFMMQP